MVRVLPTGWTALSAEAVDDGRWWVPVLTVLALVARRVIDARPIIAAVMAGFFGTVGTVLGRVVGDPSPNTLHVAVSVVVASSLVVAAAGAVQSGAGPYVVVSQTGASAFNSRGSMTGPAIAWTLAVMAAGAILCLPGVLIGLALPGVLVWLGPVVSLLLGACVVAVARRRADSLVASRGPEIYATVSA